jgi:phosphatidate cytidylyltransferase
LADGKDLSERKRDQLKRFVTLPLAMRTADLPRRLASAAVLLLLAGAAFWAGGAVLAAFIAAVALICYGEFARLVLRATPNPAYRGAGLLAGAVYVGLGAWALATLPGLALVVTVVSVIMTDSCAYFAGRAIGGPKIAPSISPSKTWAGLAGGMAGSAIWLVLVVAGVGQALSSLDTGQGAAASADALLIAAAIGGALAIAAQCGDFFESWLKRKAHVKDSSRLIPGHGGVFDRVDGLLPVAIIVGLAGGWSGW